MMPVSCYLCIFLNVGLGEGSALPVGVPVPWPSATPPTGWLKCNGAPFSAEEYPELAKAYPTNKLPDLRGEFIRGWDDGRGVDSDRALLSEQGDAIRNITGGLKLRPGSSDKLITGATGAMKIATRPESYYVANLSAAQKNAEGIDFDAASAPGVVTASENRPRNIAFNYIVRAA
ncbi:hypothetical protein LL13F56_26710 [Escherichia coli]